MRSLAVVLLTALAAAAIIPAPAESAPATGGPRPPAVAPAGPAAPTPRAQPATKESALSTQNSGPTPTIVVRLQGQIDDYNRDKFIERFNQAKAAGAKVIIVDLDTYGGLVTAGLDISGFIKSQSDVHTIAYVSRKAISAGAMIAISCDEIVMAPNAQLGDCAPIAIHDGEMQTLGKDERAKATSPILSDFKGSAIRNGYDVLLVQSMVVADIVVHWVENNKGERRFVNATEFAALTKAGWTEVKDSEVGAPVDSDTSLLTVHGGAAFKLGLAKAIHPTLESLAAARNYNITATLAPSFGDTMIEVISTPIARLFLMVIFAVSLYAVFHAPGHGMAEVIAVIALALLVGVPLMTGYAEWWEILVILIGIALLALELFVIPGFGAAGIIGILCILFGFVMTFVGRDPGGSGGHIESWWSNLQTGMATVVSAMIGSIIAASILRKYLPKLPLFNRLILTTIAGDIGRSNPLPGAPAVDHGSFWPAVGAYADAVSDLKPGGSASFYDPTIADVRVLSVISATGYISRGAKLVVLQNNDNRVLVRQQES